MSSPLFDPIRHYTKHTIHNRLTMIRFKETICNAFEIPFPTKVSEKGQKYLVSEVWGIIAPYGKMMDVEASPNIMTKENGQSMLYKQCIMGKTFGNDIEVSFGNFPTCVFFEEELDQIQSFSLYCTNSVLVLLVRCQL
jgi:hypothetical protein